MSINLKEKIQNFRDWASYRRKELIFALIIFLVASLSFGLGYLANRESSHAAIVIEKARE